MILTRFGRGLLRCSGLDPPHQATVPPTEPGAWAFLNSVPLAAIERIEVLRDGAAAQYGSDAIAGVINIVLKKGADGGSAGLDTGQTDAGDGTRASASAGCGVRRDG